MTALIMALGVSLIMFCVALILLTTDPALSSSASEFGFQFHMFIWGFTVSFIVVVAFQPPALLKSTSGRTLGNSQSENNLNLNQSTSNLSSTDIEL